MNFSAILNLNCFVRLFWCLSITLNFTLPSLADDRPNIVWIVLDDLGPELSCYGEPAVSTPAMDRLAAKGVRYTNCFSTSPVCSSSRSAFITGMYQTSIGAHHHRTRLIKPLPDGVLTVMEQFKQAGYFVCDLNPPGVKRRVKRDYNFEYSDTMFDGNDWKDRKPNQPFFAQIQIHEPHRPFHNNEKPERSEQVVFSKKYPDHPIVRADMANYLQSVEDGDNHVANIIEKLDEENLWENTYVFLFGDHGRPHVWGKQWLYDEGLRVPLIICGPEHFKKNRVDDRLVSLIDLAPTSLKLAGIEPHQRTEGLSLLDDEFSARDAIFAARDRCGEAEDRIRAVRTKKYKYIRNYFPMIPYSQLSSYKKLSYPVTTLLEVLNEAGKLSPEAGRMMQATRSAEEFYDLVKDPDELNNLADQPDHQEQLRSMSKLLDDWIESTGDAGQFAEGDMVYQQALDAEKRLWYNKTMQRRGLKPDVSNEKYLQWWSSELKLNSE